VFGLVDRVADLVQEQPQISHLSRGQIVLAATHTHHGPENFFSDKFYNSFPSSRSGFDPELFEFLAQRITQAIFDASQNLEAVAEVGLRRARLPYFFRNRSLDAFVLNQDAGDLLTINASIPDDCALVENETDGRACRAVRTQVEVLELVGSGGARIASMVFLAAHPTVLSSHNSVFTGDLFETTAMLLEQGRLADCSNQVFPLVAFFNGAQGDASITWSPERRNRSRLLNADPAAVPPEQGLAVQLAEFVCGAESGLDASPTQAVSVSAIAFQFGWLSFRNSLHAETGRPEDCVQWNEHCTTREPRPGAAAMGGAQDGRTLWYELGLQPGLRSASSGWHGRKAVGLELGGIGVDIAKLVTDSGPPPDEVPLGIYRIGTLVLATLPGEFTSMMGERIRKAIATATGAAAERVLLIGLANGHLSYVTTPEEYDAQHYEGASNLYGPATGPVIATKLVELAMKPG
jgi:neutral ceramidase